MTAEQSRIIAERDDKAMIEHPELWPTWPLLPMKNRRLMREQRDDPNGGLGYINAAFPTLLWLGCVWIRLASKETIPTMQYESIDAMLADGWVVD
jgi:hypothetical protein